MRGIIYKSTGNQYLTKVEDGSFWICILKGKLRMDGSITSSNPVAVGDEIEFNVIEEEERTGVIKKIYNRKNQLARVSPQNRKHQQHIIASNLDQAIIVATIHSPKTSLGFIDRFLVTAEAYHIPAIIVFNKKDLITEDYLDEWRYISGMYESIGYPTVTISTLDKEDIAIINELLINKRTLISGHSGVGKSSIINLLDIDRTQKVQDVSDWSGKGKHTTTFAEMLDLPLGGAIIDTPGIKELGLIHIEREELSHFFPEMKSVLSDCRFNNCMHINEPGCAVKEGLEALTISPDRYESYLSILESIPKHNY